MPVLVLIATMMFTGAVTDGFDRYYAVRVITVCLTLVYFRRSYGVLLRKFSWSAMFIGLLVFAIWIILEPRDDGRGVQFAQQLHGMGEPWTVVWLVFRFLGSVIIIPIVEELAFRGYLLRRITSSDFEHVPFNDVRPLPAFVSSVAFGALHGRWVAGTLAGICYAWAMRRNGNLCDAIVAHMTTNAILFAAVLLLGQWSLWT